MISNDIIQKFELHYFLDKGSHSIDAIARLDAETELLSIISEISRHFNIDVIVESEALSEGGVRNRWTFVSKEDITIVLAALSLILQIYAIIPSEKEERLKDLQIENLELQNKKLEAELAQMGVDEDRVEEVVQKVTDLEQTPKVRKRKSNLYSTVNSVEKVTDLGFSILDQDNEQIFSEIVIPKSFFKRFILQSNLLPDETDESAVIEIVSPVLKEGKAKWRGIYNDESISFNMKDSDFKKDVMMGKETFQHGTLIEAVLVIEKELDQVGEEKITNRSVITVLKKIDGNKSFETSQGKAYKHNRKIKSSQQALVFNDE